MTGALVRNLLWVTALAGALLSTSAHAILSKGDYDDREDAKCIGCHVNVTPGIVKQFLSSPMANTEEKEAVGCTDCHGEEHIGMDDYAKAQMPTADTCGECHKKQLKELRAGKHNLAWFGMKSQIAWHGQPGSIVREGYRGCSGCHKIGQKGFVGVRDGNGGALKHDKGMEEAHYRYGNVQCDACHTRHSFRKEEARDPRACSNCHMGFDHPQWEMYMSSKHGIVWDIEGNKNNAERAPTCQLCHMFNGSHTVKTSWGFLGLRIPTKENVLALVKVAPPLAAPLKKLAAALPSGHYDGVDDDPQWTFDRALILQAAGILDDNLQPTERFVEIVVQGEAAHGPSEFNKLRAEMKHTCNTCHSAKYVDAHFKAADEIVKEADHEFAKAISAVQGLYKDGILKKPAGWKVAPDLLQFYEARSHVEQELYLIMLEYRQRAFQGAFHVSNDYMHWYGWAPLKTAVNNILEESKKMRAEHEASKK